jgi:hypothetical protein
VPYLIIADWDKTKFFPTRINTKETEAEAQALVSQLINDLPPKKRAPNAFYAEIPAEGWDTEYIIVDPSAKTVTYNTSQETTDKTAKSFEQLRQERDKLLDGTDWIVTMHKELGTNIPTAWKTYRQELRDLPTTADMTKWPEITWPTEPS